ncbi:helix-turn-helix transcriptional regulator [Nocardia sp. NPDC058633]|uniref:helix-turn-helix transcriptional regulator n=1 Tax=Nocardia sp. NPDC058633 TaxID=3346568 RepID=UPI00365B403C
MDEAAALLDRCLGEAVRILRVTRRLSQTDLAKKVRVSTKTMGMIERGQTSMSMRKMLEVATALKVEVGDLVKRATDLQASGFTGSQTS